jgi:hypothetical protein
LRNGGLTCVADSLATVLMAGGMRTLEAYSDSRALADVLRMPNASQVQTGLYLLARQNLPDSEYAAWHAASEASL